MSDTIFEITLYFSLILYAYWFIFIMISGIFGYLVGYYLKVKRLIKNATDVYSLIIAMVFSIIFATLLYLVKIFFRFGLSINEIITIEIYSINLMSILILINIHKKILKKHTIGKTLKIDDKWHENENIQHFKILAVIIIGISISGFIYSIIRNIYNEIIEFHMFFLIYIFLYLYISNYAWIPFKYKISATMIEFNGTWYGPEEKKLEDKELELIKIENLRLPKGTKKGLLIKNPNKIDLTKIFCFKLKNANDEQFSKFIMEDGTIYSLEPLTANYLEQLSQILPMEKMVKDIEEILDTEPITKSPPPRKLKESVI